MAPLAVRLVTSANMLAVIVLKQYVRQIVYINKKQYLIGSSLNLVVRSPQREMRRKDCGSIKRPFKKRNLNIGIALIIKEIMCLSLLKNHTRTTSITSLVAA